MWWRVLTLLQVVRRDVFGEAAVCTTTHMAVVDRAHTTEPHTACVLQHLTAHNPTEHYRTPRTAGVVERCVRQTPVFFATHPTANVHWSRFQIVSQQMAQ